MDIFFINSDYLNKKNKTCDKPLINKYHHKYSRFFLKKILETFYNIDDEICVENNKPYIKSNKKYFSISHSNKIIAIAFDNNKIGFDLEFKRELNYKKILNRYNVKNIDNITLNNFFQIWTNYEAEYKSKIYKNILNFNYNEYMCAVSSENNIIPVLYEIDTNMQIQPFELKKSNILPPINIKLMK